MSVELEQFGKPTRTSLVLVDGIGFNDWKGIGERLATMGDSCNWWLGDWLAYGDRYRREYPVAMQQIDRSYAALTQYAYVASKVEVCTRVQDLSWTHHRVVAPFETEQQRYWLDEAQRHGWSKRELEQAIAEASERPGRAPAFSVRAVGELYELCTRAADAAGVTPAEWAATALKRAALSELELAAV